MPHAEAATARQRQWMDAGWRFHLAAAPRLAHGVGIVHWRWQSRAPGSRGVPPGPGPAWQPARIGEDVFQGRTGYAWFRAALPDVHGPRRMLHFESVDDNATVFLNGKRLLYHAGWNDPFDVPLDTAWKPGAPNIVTVLVENTDGPGGLGAPVTLGTNPVQFRDDPSRPGYNDRAWRVVHLPHDYVVEGKFTPTADTSHGSLPTPPAWYRKTFTLPASDRGKDVWIDFDGVYRDAKVFLNGHFLGEYPSGYTSFRYDISKAAHYGGKNVLAVSVNPRHFEGWWYEGGGIYRHVWLNVAAPLHIAPWGVFASAKLPEPGPSGQAAPAAVTIKTTLTNAGAGAACRLISTVVDDAGKTVGRAVSPVIVPKGGNRTVAQQVIVTHPRLWSLETPRLYHVVQTVERDGQEIDRVTTPFGIRTIRFDANKGFFLNGKSVKIKGVCNHQDFAGVGIGVPDTLEYWRVKQLKKMGCNAWRTAHNPPTPALLDACDRLGMLVMDENRHLGDTYAPKTSPGTPYSDLSDLTSMIRRDRNHPSIIMWSMCNEEPLQGTPEGDRIFTAMKRAVRKYDTTRPVTCAMNDGGYHGVALVEDLRGFNYGPGIYAPYHRDHPDIPIFGSETASTVSTRGIYSGRQFGRYFGIPEKGYVSAYDLNAPPWAQTAEDSWQPQAEAAFVAGGFAWTGFDYKGEPTPFGWPDINSNFGILDMCGFPKDGFYYYQAWWGDRPVVHLLPHWNWSGKEGQPISVWVYSNADKVALSLNGRSLGIKSMPKNGHVSWDVPYAPGKLVARGYRDGRTIATDTVQTTGSPAALRLTTDRTMLTANGEDMTLVTVDVVDAQGRVVPTAGNRVTFQVQGAGRIAGVGNGDPSDHDPDQATFRRAFSGKCLVIVGAGEQPGKITLLATSPGLKRATLPLQAH